MVTWLALFVRYVDHLLILIFFAFADVFEINIWNVSPSAIAPL